MPTAKTVDGKADLFGHEGQAQMYREFRPRYSDEITRNVLSFVPQESRNLYVDVACGSGQLTFLIAPAFKKSIGVDMSLEQLGHAPAVGSVALDFVAGSAFSLPVESGSADLVTVAQGLHWLLPYDKFFNEVDRVLKRGGAFVTVAYAFPRLVDSGPAKDAVERFYVDVLGSKLSPGQPGCWWDTNRPTIDGYYSDIPFPASTTTTRLSEKKKISVSHYVNYLRTFSAFRTYLAAGNVDPLPVLLECITDACGEEVLIEVPYFTVAYTKE